MPITAEHPSDHHNERPEEAQHDVGVGVEMHGAVYIVMGLAYAWIMVMAWIAFGWNVGVDLDLSFASLVIAVMIGLPLLVYTVARAHLKKSGLTWDEFFNSRVEIATGSLKGWQAGLEIAVIPVALAFGATLIGIVWLLTPSGGASSG